MVRSSTTGVRARVIALLSSVSAIGVVSCTFGSTYQPPSLCQPVDPVGFTAHWVGFKTSTACTSDVMAGFDSACDGSSATADDCAAWNDANGDCASCLFSNETDSTYGARITAAPQTGVVAANLAGCVAKLEGHPDGDACGGAFQAVEQCERAACSTCPDVNDGQGAEHLQGCLDAARAMPTCAPLDSKAQSCKVFPHARDVCGLDDSSKQFDGVALVLCGGQQ